MPLLLHFPFPQLCLLPASIFICLGLRTAMVEALASKTMAWEKERGVEFTYDGVSTSPRSLKVKSLSSWSHLNIYIYIYSMFSLNCFIKIYLKLFPVICCCIDPSVIYA